MSNDGRYHCLSGAASDDEDALAALVAGGTTALTLGVAFGLSALGVDSFWVAFPVGFGVVLPGALALTHARRAGDPRTAIGPRTADSPAGLEALRRRYVAGEISDEEFEHRVERLLESEAEPPTRGRGNDG